MKLLTTLIPYLIFILLWSVLARFTGDHYFVGVEDAVVTLWELMTEHGLWRDVLKSFHRVSMAMMITFLVAIPLGIWIGFSQKIQWIFSPLTGFLRFIPAPALIPLTIFWFGVGEWAKVFIIVWGIFFPALLVIRDATTNIPRAYLDLAQSLGYTPLQKCRRIVLPWILPDIASVFRILFAVSWIYLVIAELVAAHKGVGHALIIAQRFLRVDQMFALVILVGLLGMIFDRLFRYFIDKEFFWKCHT